MNAMFFGFDVLCYCCYFEKTGKNLPEKQL